MFTLHFNDFFLSFQKNDRKCWKNCALPVFFDNNNIKKKNRSRLFLFSFCVLDSEAWESHWLVLSELANQQEGKGLGIFFVFSCVLSFHSIISTQAKFLKSLLKDLFAFCLTFWWCTVLYSETIQLQKQYLKDESFSEPFVLTSFSWNFYLQSLNQMTTLLHEFNAFKYLKCIFFLETACFGKFFLVFPLEFHSWNWLIELKTFFWSNCCIVHHLFAWSTSWLVCCPSRKNWLSVLVCSA